MLRFIKNLRYLCLAGIVALALIIIIGSNGGDGDTLIPIDDPTILSEERQAIGETYNQWSNALIAQDYDQAMSLVVPGSNGEVQQTKPKALGIGVGSIISILHLWKPG